jgi:hypothetical protein
LSVTSINHITTKYISIFGGKLRERDYKVIKKESLSLRLCLGVWRGREERALGG